MPSLRFTVTGDDLVYVIPEPDAWILLYALRGGGVANDPLGSDIANRLEAALHGAGVGTPLELEEERAVFASLDLLRGTDGLSPELAALHRATARDLDDP